MASFQSSFIAFDGFTSLSGEINSSTGRRLRSAGVSFEDRQDLLGHKSSRITTHYSTAELQNLWEAANKVSVSHARPTLTLLRTDAVSRVVCEF